MTMVDHAHARWSDPSSSDFTVKSIAADVRGRELVLAVAATFDQPWCDTELWERTEALTGRRHQRNVLARTRGLMEEDGLIQRVGQWTFRGRPGVVHFIVPGPTTQQEMF
jgi:hypothetical protein